MPTIKRHLSLWALTVLFVAAMSIGYLDAQVDKATISGTALDSTGAVVTGAKIQAKNVGTGVVYPSVTDLQGRYIIPELPVGGYEISATKDGFQKVVRTGITLTVGARPVVDFNLPVGKAEEVVEVQGQVSQVDTQTSSLSSLVAARQMQDLPLNGRNFSQLLTLSAGVSEVPQNAAGGGVSLSFYGRGTNYSVSGSRPVGQAFLLDNTDIRGFWEHGAGSSVTGNSLGMDAIQEFTVLTNTYSAEFGGTGAAVNAVTKSGTNSLHGSGYEFIRNSALDAKNYFDVRDANIPPFRRNQFGGTLGGPIKRDKAFFFGNYEGLRSSTGITSRALVPAAAQHDLPFANTPSGLAAKGVMDLYPRDSNCTQPGFTPGLTQWFCSDQDFIVNEDYALGRVDLNLGPKDTLFGRYVFDRARQVIPYPSSLLPGWPELGRTRNQYFTVEERRTVSPRFINAARFSYVRTLETAASGGNFPQLDFAPGSGRQNASVGPGSGVVSIGSGSSTPFRLVQNKFSGEDAVIFSLGAHNLKFGASVTRIQTAINAPFGVGGFWLFQTLGNFQAGSPFLYLGQAGPDFSIDGIPYSLVHHFREITFHPYIQDDWKISPKLTVNLGVRYEYGTNPVAAGGVPMYAVLDPLRDQGYTRVDHAMNSNPNVKNFDPRIGIAWDPFADHKTSIRAGFGVFHEPIAPRTYSNAYYQAPPSPTLQQINLPFDPLIFPRFPTFAGHSAAFAGFDYFTDYSPYVMQWNLTVQREVAAGTVFSVGYNGSAGVHLMSLRDMNFPLAASDQFRTACRTPNASGQCPNPGFNPAATGKRGSPTNPFVGVHSNEFLSSWNADQGTAHSSYHGVQASLNRQFSKSLIGQVAYTWSRCIDDGSASSGLEQGSFEVTSPQDQSYDRGLCTFNTNQAFRLNAVYSLSFTGNRLVEGWQLSPIFSVTTGLPMNVQTSFSSANGQSRLGGIEGERASYANGQKCNRVLEKVDNWYDPTCYVLPPFGVLGNVGRNTIIGPGFLNLDFAVNKTTKLTEKLNMQFRAEFFNIMNHPSFQTPDPGTSGAFLGGPVGPTLPFTTIPNPVYPAILTQTTAPFLPGGVACPNSGLLPSDTCYNPNAGRLVRTQNSSRQIQFAVKFLF